VIILKLEEISNIFGGVVLLRKEAKTREGHKYKLITLKSVSKSGIINPSDLGEYHAKGELPEKYIAKEGDIIVRIRPPIYGGYVDKEVEGAVIPSYFIKIRLNKEYINKLLPKFLALYINSKKAQKEFNKDIVGTTITMIKPTNIKKLDIPIIPLDKQKQIIKLSELINRELDLLNKLIELKEKYYNNIIEKVI